MEGNIDKQDTGESKTDRGKERGMMRTYATQMEAARKGIVTPEMKAVAEKEYRSEEEIRELVAKGQVAICANRLHTCIDPNGVGSMLRTKINVNLGVSRDCKDYDVEMQKSWRRSIWGPRPLWICPPTATRSPSAGN